MAKTKLPSKPLEAPILNLCLVSLIKSFKPKHMGPKQCTKLWRCQIQAVGNEIKPDGPYAQFLFPAMQNIKLQFIMLALEERLKSPLPFNKIPSQSPTLHQ